MPTVAVPTVAVAGAASTVATVAAYAATVPTVAVPTVAVVGAASTVATVAAPKVAAYAATAPTVAAPNVAVVGAASTVVFSGAAFSIAAIAAQQRTGEFVVYCRRMQGHTLRVELCAAS